MLMLDRYIWKAVLQSWLLVMLVLLGLDTIFSFIDQLGDLKREYQVMEAFIYVLATLPDSAFELVSMATLLACLIGLGQLAGNSELIILRACGLSVSRILFSVIQPVLLIIGGALFTAQFISPYTSEFAESYRATKSGGSEFANFEKGIWQREGNSFVYINHIASKGSLHGVNIFSFDENRALEESRFISQVDIAEGEWRAQNLETIKLENGTTYRQEKETESWQSEITLRMLKLLAVGPEKLSVSSLYQYGEYLERQNQSSAKYHLEFWNKLFLPLSTMAMVLIAGSFVFGSLRETPMGSRIIVGVVIALVFNQVQTLSSHMALVYQFSPVIAALLPALIALVIGGVMVRRTF
jgi:lipopolysaccharide export system permease protein